MRVRLLHVTITAAALVLALRAAELWHDAGVAFAQSPTPAEPAKTEPAKAEPQAAQAKGADAAAPAPSAAASLPVTEYTDKELAVLQELAERREQLDSREAEIVRREALLKAAEQRIEAKLEELKKLQASIETVVRRYDEQEDARKKSLVRIFESMKPAEAAQILEQMELPVVVELIERMKERNAAPVLAQMHPARAKQLTAELARRRQPGGPAAASPNG
ncbi:MAG TPA: hypothetical protein VF342_07975 [Alphaproteobacteria bacterium]